MTDNSAALSRSNALFGKGERWFKRFSLITALFAVCAGVITYSVVTDRPFLGADTRTYLWLIIIDVILLVGLSAVVGIRAWRAWRRRRQNLAGAQLHIQLMSAFTALTALPTLFVAICAVLFINAGVETWFGKQIKVAVDESQAIAQSYLEEHQRSIRADTLAMATDLNREAARLTVNPEFLQEYFKTQAYLRNLSEALMLDSTGKVVARAGITFSLEFLPGDFEAMVARANNDETVLFVGDKSDRVRAFVRLDNFLDAYLYVGRIVDENVLSRVSATNKAAKAYQNLESKQAQLKLTMSVLFTLVALMLLLVAIWAGLTLAERIVEPISRLIQASERIRAGDLNVRVDESDSKYQNEMLVLARAFNRMTDQLSNQRRDLISANQMLDQRRRFTEAVLTGVNAGVIGLDEKGTIQIVNASAEKLFGMDADAMLGKKILELSSDMEKLRRLLRGKPGRTLESPIDIRLPQSTLESHWIVRISADGDEDKLRGYVVTFDDLSPLIDAQRKAAWSDVARRVAHEIKNPLTPIQLSAERLKKRYGKQIIDDAETFNVCTDTIIRHVDDIRRMVDEFSAFARMPNASKQRENMVTLSQQALVLLQHAHPEVRFTFNRPEQPLYALVDRQQITQALTNILKNAFEALEASETSAPEITLTITEQQDDIIIDIADNGPGWPTDLLPRLTDPYITTKATGTGLGLSIVDKIIQDHNARMLFLENAPKGALLRLIFKKGETVHV